MKPLYPLMLVAALTAGPAIAGDVKAVCGQDPRANGMAERIEGMNHQMLRIERSNDRGEQRRLLDLHLKSLHEGLHAMDARAVGSGCRLEVMQAMLEQMTRHQLAAEEGGR